MTDQPAERVFLVVVDDSEEWRAALLFACRRARKTGGRVALLTIIEPGDFQHWMAVEAVMRQELRQEAEERLSNAAAEVRTNTGRWPVLHIREGGRAEQVLELIEEEPSISILVLGSSESQEGPGPIISHLMDRSFGRLRVPVTIVPGHLGANQIHLIA